MRLSRLLLLVLLAMASYSTTGCHHDKKVIQEHNQALQVANGTQYALTGGLYSRSPEHIQRVRREFRVGNLYVNRKITGALVSRQPFEVRL